MFFGSQSEEGEFVGAVELAHCVACLVHQVVDEAGDVNRVVVVHRRLQGDAIIIEDDDACDSFMGLNPLDGFIYFSHFDGKREFMAFISLLP